MPHPWLEVFGRFHPVVLHLPIGLWAGVVALEFGAAAFRRPGATGAVVVLAWFAAVTGVLAAATGWVLAEEGDFTAGRLDLHRWTGVGVAAFGVISAATAAMAKRRSFRLLLSATCAGLIFAGHLGGSLTHGDGFLLEPLAATRQRTSPASPPTAPQPDPNPVPAAPETRGPVQVPAQDESHFAARILPILHRTCIPCHGEDKQKADLRLDSPEAILAGSENGAVLEPGKPDDSPMLTRLLLPLDHEDHMPPPKKPQPSAAEIEDMRAWIQAGAPFSGPMRRGG